MVLHNISRRPWNVLSDILPPYLYLWSDALWLYHPQKNIKIRCSFPKRHSTPNTDSSSSSITVWEWCYDHKAGDFFRIYNAFNSTKIIKCDPLYPSKGLQLVRSLMELLLKALTVLYFRVSKSKIATSAITTRKIWAVKVAANVSWSLFYRSLLAYRRALYLMKYLFSSNLLLKT